MPDSIEQLTIFLPAAKLAQLSKYAYLQNITVSELMNNLINQTLEKAHHHKCANQTVDIEMIKELEYTINDRINNLDHRISGEIAKIIDEIEDKIEHKVKTIHLRIDQINQLPENRIHN